MAPLADVPQMDPRWNARGSTQPPRGAGWQRAAPRLPPGFRWIAVRPGAAPRARPRRRPLGPTPRYVVIPRWGLADRIDESSAGQAGQAPPTPKGPSAATVRATLFAAMLVLGIAALVYLVRYVLLIINRNTLLNPVVAAVAFWLGVVASVAALGVVITCFVVLVRWLIARRAAAFTHHGQPEPRPTWALWAGCLVPLANLAWAPVYVIELASIEDHLARLRKPILVWWIVWIISTTASIFAIATSGAKDAQGIGNNTVAMTVAYLLAAAAVAAVARIFEGFERKPVERPAHRWVVVADDRPAAHPPAAVVELAGQEPAA